MSLNQNKGVGVDETEREGGSSAYDASQSRDSIESEIEKNLLIKTMPRKFKVSAPDPENTKNKTVGIVIMVIGILVMGVAAYLVYIFLINPTTNNGLSVVAPTKKEIPVDKKSNDSIQSNKESTPVNTNSNAPKEEVKSVSSQINDNKASSSDNILATTTPVDTKKPEVATSTSAEKIADKAETIPTVVKKAIDTDKDGLSDKEESILGLSASVADSDNDGFSDSSELSKMYNPAGAGRLSDNPNLVSYKNITYKYSVLKPAVWKVQQVGDSIIFSSTDNSFIQIITERVENGSGVLAWYNEQFPDKQKSLSDVMSKNGWEGLFHDDGQIFYLIDAKNKNNIFTVSYTPSEEGNDDYYNIFKMIIDSFSF